MTTAAASWATRPPTSTRTRPASSLPTGCTPGGWSASTAPRATTDARLPAAVSIGTNPTFDGTQRRVEAYVLDRTDLDLYGERVAIELVARLRPTVRFDSVDGLLVQMADDVKRSRELLGRE